MSVVVEVSNRSAWAVDEAAARGVLAAALAAESVEDGEVGLAFVGPDEMAGLNGMYRDRAEPTDVLSFPLDALGDLPAGVPRQLGDVVVCPDVAAAEGTPIATLLVHGALHLVGHDHDADGGEMLRRQAALVAEAEPVGAEPA